MVTATFSYEEPALSRRGLSTVLSAVALTLGATACTQGSAVERRAIVADDASPGEVRVVSVEPIGDLGIGAVSASSAHFRMTATLGPSFAQLEPGESPAYSAPVDPR